MTNTTDHDKEMEKFLNSEEFLEIARLRDPEEDVMNELLEKISKLHDGNILFLTSKLHEMCFDLMVKSFVEDINKHTSVHRIISFQKWIEMERGVVALTKAHPDEEKFKVETYIDLNGD